MPVNNVLDVHNRPALEAAFTRDQKIDIFFFHYEIVYGRSSSN